MNEWTVVQVIALLFGLFITVGAPVIRLNGTITKLNISMENLDMRVRKFEEKNSKSHQRIWEKNAQQDLKLIDHGERLKNLEKEIII